jgi:hypothetical protein
MLTVNEVCATLSFQWFQGGVSKKMGRIHCFIHSVKMLTKSCKNLVCSLEVSTLAEKFDFGIQSASFHDLRVGYLVEFFVSPEFSIKILPLPGIRRDRSTIYVHVFWKWSLDDLVTIKFSKSGLKLDKPA